MGKGLTASLTLPVIHRLLCNEIQSCVIQPGVNDVESSYLFTRGVFFLGKHLILRGQMAE